MRFGECENGYGEVVLVLLRFLTLEKRKVIPLADRKGAEMELAGAYGRRRAARLCRDVATISLIGSSSC